MRDAVRRDGLRLLLGHLPRNFFPAPYGGDAAILYCFVFLYMVAAGPGVWSLDHASERQARGAGQRTAAA